MQQPRSGAAGQRRVALGRSTQTLVAWAAEQLISLGVNTLISAVWLAPITLADRFGLNLARQLHGFAEALLKATPDTSRGGFLAAPSAALTAAPPARPVTELAAADRPGRDDAATPTGDRHARSPAPAPDLPGRAAPGTRN